MVQNKGLALMWDFYAQTKFWGSNGLDYPVNRIQGNDSSHEPNHCESFNFNGQDMWLLNSDIWESRIRMITVACRYVNKSYFWTNHKFFFKSEWLVYFKS